MEELITSDVAVLGGTPVFSNTRVPVRALLDYLESGKTINDFNRDFPSVPIEKIKSFMEKF